MTRVEKIPEHWVVEDKTVLSGACGDLSQPMDFLL